MRGARWAFLAVVFIAGFPSIAIGQQSQTLRDRDPDIAAAKKVAAEVQQANFHWGSFYLQSRLRLADAGFASDISVPTGDSSGGVRIAVEAPQRLYYVPHRKMVLSADLVPSYAFLGNGEGQFDYTARADAHFLWNHLYLDPYVILTDKIRAHVAEINRLATAREGEVGVNGEWKHSSRTSAIFALRNRTLSYPCSRPGALNPCDRLQPRDQPMDLLDREEVTGRLALHHKTFPLTSIFVAAEGGKYEFDRTSFKDSTSAMVSGGLLYDSGRTKVRAEAGLRRLDFESDLEKDFQGLTGSASVERARGRWAYGATVARDVSFAIFAGNNYFESTTATAGISRRVGRSITVRANGLREHDVFPNPTPDGGLVRTDDISFYSTGFTYGFWKINVGTDIGWYERTSTFGGDSDSGIRWLLHLSFTL